MKVVYHQSDINLEDWMIEHVLRVVEAQLRIAKAFNQKVALTMWAEDKYTKQ